MMAKKHGILFFTGRALFVVLILIIFIYTVFPFVWTVLSSFKTEDELIQTPTSYIPERPTLDNYIAVFENPQFLRGLVNSAAVAGSVVLLSLAIGAFAAYALGRLKFVGKRFIMYIVLAMTLFPQISILAGLFAVVRELGLYGSIFSLILSYMIFTLQI